MNAINQSSDNEIFRTHFMKYLGVIYVTKERDIKKDHVTIVSNPYGETTALMWKHHNLLVNVE